MTDYEQDTRNAYLTPEKALAYKRCNSIDWTWGRFVTWFAQRMIAQELRRHRWTSTDRLLDIPCGAGILGKTLQRFPLQIVASDISPEMLALARSEYPAGNPVEFVRADITATNLPRGAFACVVTLGFLHRVPLKIKRAALLEISSLCNRIAIVSFSADSPLQRMKHSLLSLVKRSHEPAPCPMPLNEFISLCEDSGFQVLRVHRALPLLSSYVLLVLEKKSGA